VCLNREDGLCAVGFVMRCVLWSVDFKVTVCFVGVQSGAGNIDVWLLAQIVSFCRNKLDYIPNDVNDVRLSESLRSGGTITVDGVLDCVPFL